MILGSNVIMTLSTAIPFQSCEDKSDDVEKSVIQQTGTLFNSGVRTVSVNFKKDGHFLQKDRARFIAEGIEAMLRK
ncbi:hypothetical protein Y032_0005g2500 [Ancylostoma ceylanicum]|uniref:Uncharacterized protein n=2 Tax=Ancylostoma ceylanicum TaxID=53326 RepID=A0A016VRZ3_9BILA|nr:hypothetical protein Y032_0005g2500 [Ancylostoma ceylanicum]